MENTIATPTATEGSPMRARLEIGLILLGLLALLFLMPHTISSDGQDRFNELTLLLGKGIIPTRKYSMIGPIFAAPLWLLGNPFHVAYALVSRFNWLLFSTGLLVMYVLLRRRLDPTLLRTFILILIAGSMFPNHLSNFYGETFTAMFVGVGLLVAVVVGGRARLGGWFAVALGVANTPATLVGLGLIVVRRVWETRRLRPVLLIAATGALIGAENWIRRGSPLHGGYEAGFTNPFFFGLLGILFSFGKGLFFYTPGLLLPVRARILTLRQGAKAELYSVYLLWLCFVAGLVLAYAPWWAWDGGWYWGPRFFLLASFPASLALAVRLRNRTGVSTIGNLATLVVLGLSVWVGINGAVFDQRGLDSLCLGHSAIYGPYCQYVPQYSALWHLFVVFESLDWRNILYILYAVAVFAYLAAPLLADLATAALAFRDRAFRVALAVRW
jgi:hypothetical protein